MIPTCWKSTISAVAYEASTPNDTPKAPTWSSLIPTWRSISQTTTRSMKRYAGWPPSSRDGGRLNQRLHADALLRAGEPDRQSTGQRSSSRELLDAKRPALGLCLRQIVVELLAEPALRSGAEGDRQTDRHLRANASAAVQDA